MKKPRKIKEKCARHRHRGETHMVWARGVHLQMDYRPERICVREEPRAKASRRRRRQRNSSSLLLSVAYRHLNNPENQRRNEVRLLDESQEQNQGRAHT